MALPPFRSKAVHHSRSLSLPCKSHKATSQIKENVSGASCSSLSSMNNRVKNLNNLYSNTHDLLMLPHIQHIIVQEKEHKEKWVDDVLDGYITLLDACATAKDLVSNTKQRVHELLSSLRRKDVDGIRSYLDSRRETKKIIDKSFKDLTSKHNVKHHETTTDLAFSLKETELVTFTLFQSLLSYLTGAKLRSTWSLVSKKVVSCQGEGMQLNEFEKIDGLLRTNLEGVWVDEATTRLKEIESSIRVLEEDLQCLFRQLIRTRVFLLNILNH